MTSIALLLAASIATAAPETARLSVIEKGAMPQIGYYMPVRVELKAEAPETLRKAPKGLAAPKYGVLPVKTPAGAIHVILDEPDDGEARLFIDADGNGDITDAERVEWKGTGRAGEDGKTYTMYSGGGIVSLGEPGAAFQGNLAMYRFDKNDPQRAALKNTLLFYRDYAAAGELTLGGKTYRVMLADDANSGSFKPAALSEDPAELRAPTVRLLIDVDGNGKFDRRGESYDVRQPFNIKGTTWQISEVAADGTSFRVGRSETEVEEILPPPDHSVGKKILAFDATLMDGKPVRFPSDYQGKIVLLDFWATWCGPCIKELPGLSAAYEKYHGRGFDVLGVSFDKENAEEAIRRVAEQYKAPWPHIYEGKFWDTTLGKKYVIQGIPAAFLVDGDTGEILAVGNDLRGERLDKTIADALKKKKLIN